ncbi:hypothetical protein CC78DRAFT_538150 [Lojkania enalia]|uniref:Uncharacterized protein n=1 Tax=Lojkania enalia TaxID=147567 RepID=A0A9P4JWZ8_9PLEO|nr:hypothetical protein CC78DRAFT_538150 [Didymosphaeria enalia]
MASRLLPIALATISGIAIGVTTFGPEFQEQRKKRLEEAYQRDVAALGSKAESPPSSKSEPNPNASSESIPRR